jgi:hypothetical protein
LRPSKIIDSKITDYGDDNTTNYMHVSTKQIEIRKHKNERNGEKVIDISSDKSLYVSLEID